MRKTILATLVALSPVAAFAADPLADAIAARQGYYKLLGANMNVLAGMAQGKMDYDATSAQTAADNLVVMAGYDASHLFVSGTTAEEMPGITRLRQAALDDLPGMGERFMAFADAAKAMQQVAGNGQGEMAGALGDLGGSCKGCHQDYRAK